MIVPTILTWILVIAGIIIYLPLVYGQFLMVRDPQSQKTRDIVIGKGEQWRDTTHFRFCYGGSWGDMLIQFPLLVAGSFGVLTGTSWGYVLWISLGFISVYISIILWFTEKEYVYPKWGALAYYTFYWGFFVYWGILAAAYGILRLEGKVF